MPFLIEFLLVSYLCIRTRSVVLHMSFLIFFFVTESEDTMEKHFQRGRLATGLGQFLVVFVHRVFIILSVYRFAFTIIGFFAVFQCSF